MGYLVETADPRCCKMCQQEPNEEDSGLHWEQQFQELKDLKTHVDAAALLYSRISAALQKKEPRGEYELETFYGLCRSWKNIRDEIGCRNVEDLRSQINRSERKLSD